MFKIRTITFILIISTILIADVQITNPQIHDVVAIVNKKRGKLSKEEVKNIYTGITTRWPDGREIKLLLNKNKLIYSRFCKKYLNKSSRDIDEVWTRKHIRDGIPLPRKLPSSVIIMLVSNSPDFIGFVKHSEAGDKVQIVE